MGRGRASNATNTIAREAHSLAVSARLGGVVSPPPGDPAHFSQTLGHERSI